MKRHQVLMLLKRLGWLSCLSAADAPEMYFAFTTTHQVASNSCKAALCFCSGEKQAAPIPSNLLLWFPVVRAQNRYSSTQRDPLKQAAAGVCPRSGGHPVTQGLLLQHQHAGPACSGTLCCRMKRHSPAMPGARWALSPGSGSCTCLLCPFLGSELCLWRTQMPSLQFWCFNGLWNSSFPQSSCLEVQNAFRLLR